MKVELSHVAIIEFHKGARLSTRVLAVGLLGLIVSLTIHGPFAARSVGAAELAAHESTADYDGYPLAFVPEGCTAQGADILIGERFTSTSDTRWVDNFRKLNPGIKDVVTMAWDAIAPGCEGGMIQLSAKLSLATTFVLDDEQYGAYGSSCGPEGPSCEDVGNQLSIDLAELGVAPCYQLDAHLGPQLETVGPSGDYYGIFNRDHNMLIAAKNGGVLPCDDTNPILEGEIIRKSTPCPLDPAIPLVSIRCQKSLDEPTTTTTTDALQRLAPPTSSTTTTSLPQDTSKVLIALPATTTTTTTSTTTSPSPVVPPTTEVPATTTSTSTSVPPATEAPAATTSTSSPVVLDLVGSIPKTPLSVPDSLPFTDPTTPTVTLPATGDRRAVLGITGMAFIGSGVIFLRAARQRSAAFDLS